jgi:Holliday junction DNA helicase RuvA
MIGRLSGILFDKNPAQLVVDCNGVGYEVSVPMSTFYNLPSTGERVMLLTHMVVREDAQLLYGFGTTQERELFRQLIKISGVGARTALAILSGGVDAASSNDVLSALLALGYSEKEALLAIKQVPSGSSVSDGIRHALKALSRA